MRTVLKEMHALLEKLEPREATRARLRAIAQAVKNDDATSSKKPTSPPKRKRKLGPGEKMVFGRIVKS